MQSNSFVLRTKGFVSALSLCRLYVCFQVQTFFIYLHWSKNKPSTLYSSSFVIFYSSFHPYSSLIGKGMNTGAVEWKNSAVNLDANNLLGFNNVKHTERLPLLSLSSLSHFHKTSTLSSFVRLSAFPPHHTQMDATRNGPLTSYQGSWHAQGLSFNRCVGDLLQRLGRWVPTGTEIYTNWHLDGSCQTGWLVGLYFHTNTLSQSSIHG